MNKKIITSVTAALMAIGVVVGVASAASATISFQGITPTYQVTSGPTDWTASWSGNGTYSSVFFYGDGGYTLYPSKTNSDVIHPHRNFLCGKVYQQEYRVSTASVYSGTEVPC